MFGTPSADSTFEKAVRSVGKGKVYTGYDIKEVLQLENITKDVALPEGEQKLLWIHRKDKEEHYYFISNQSNDSKRSSVVVSYSWIVARNMEPGNGFDVQCSCLGQWQMIKRMLQLDFEAYGSVFVVFRKAAVAKHGFTALQLNGKPVNPFDYLFIKGSKFFLRLKEPGDYVLFSGDNNSLKKTQNKKACCQDVEYTIGRCRLKKIGAHHPMLILTS